MKTNETTGLELVLTENINSVECEIYKAFGFDGAITREKLGAALGYENPRMSISNIHRRHKERLDSRSGVTKLITPDGGTQQTVVYSIEGALEICRWSKQPVADLVMDTLYAIFKKLLTTGSVSLSELPSMVKQLASKDRRYAVEHLVPALIEAKVEQTTLIKELTGVNVMDYKGGGFGKAIESRLAINDEAAMTIGRWRHSGLRVYKMDDLPEVFRGGMARLKIDEASRKKYEHCSIVNYCSEVYFDINGFREILGMGIRWKIITRASADEVMLDKTGLNRV